MEVELMLKAIVNSRVNGPYQAFVVSQARL